MFAAVGNRVIALHRVSFGEFGVDELAIGEYKILHPKEDEK
jgi:16S rRNA U516 pseudouridylate synthase RsuA-like enzyme